MKLRKVPVARDKIYIMYSRKDAKAVEEIRPFLSSLEPIIWIDTKIEPGEHWEAEIESALSTTRVALALISQSFLTSDFIMKREIPTILAAKRQGVKVISLVLRPCYLEAFPDLAALQMFNPDNEPLSLMGRNKRETLLVRLAAAIRREMAAPSSNVEKS